MGQSCGENSNGNQGVYLGALSGQNQTGERVVLVGYGAGESAVGDDNTMVGHFAGAGAGAMNTIVGSSAGINLGQANTVVGYQAAEQAIGEANTILGFSAGRQLNGDGNICIGIATGASLFGSDNIMIGNGLGATSSNYLGIGPNIYGDMLQKTMTIDSELAIGTSGNIPEAQLHVKNTGLNTTTCFLAEDQGTSGQQTIVAILESNTSDRPTLLFSEFPDNTAANGMSIEYNGSSSGVNDKLVINGLDAVPFFEFTNGGVARKTGGGSWAALSDRRLKKNISEYNEGLDALMQIEPKTYQYNELSKVNSNTEYVGVITQELQEIAPYMVSTLEMDGEEYLQVDNSAMTYMLINAIQEQQKIIEEMKKRIRQLENN